jgi:CRP/FNR family transcriptional regulator, cyclic AMP receptor protein
MNLDIYRKVMARIPLLNGLAPEELKTIVRISRLVKVRENVALIKEGETGDAVYFLMDGVARVFQSSGGKPLGKQLADLTAPNVLGEMALVDGAPRSATIVTVSQAVLLRVDLEAFNKLRATFHSGAFKILRKLALTLCERLDEKFVRFAEACEATATSADPLADLIRSQMPPR